MLVIIEGPDGSGKSTLAAKLSELSGAVVHHHGPYKGHREIAQHYWRSIDDVAFGDGVIMDRSWISEPIYGEIVRRTPSRIGVNERRALERGALGASGVVIMCRSSYEFCHANWVDRQEDEYVRSNDHTRRIWSKYAALESPLPELSYDAEEGLSFAEVIDQVVELRSSIENVGPGTGCFQTGNVLVVTSGTVPFAVGRPTFNAGLEPVQIQERELYWVEAGADPAFLEKLRPRFAVGIGAKAEQWLGSAGILEYEACERPTELARALSYVPGL